MTELKRTWLIQRLEKPRPSGLLGRDNPFAFGGGLKNGGLSADAMDLLREIFAFEYMGAAEFEFGAVPEALQSLAASSKKLAATSFTIPLSQVSEGWSRSKKPAPTGEATVYTLCRTEWADEVEHRIREWAAGGYRAKLKESTNLDTTLRPTEDFHGRTVGWLEISNGFMFFTDEQMWSQACDLFGVKSKAVSR